MFTAHIKKLSNQSNIAFECFTSTQAWCRCATNCAAENEVGNFIISKFIEVSYIMPHFGYFFVLFIINHNIDVFC